MKSKKKVFSTQYKQNQSFKDTSWFWTYVQLFPYSLLSPLCVCGYIP